MNKSILLVNAVAVWSLWLFPGVAQVTADKSLLNENSVIDLQNNRVLVKGGASRGNTLFHSLKELSIQKGQQVYFNNPSNINIILTRVTGGKLSNIDGTLGVLGGADLFLINPSGIHFGTNTFLDLNGSFIATTGNSITFKDGLVFSAIVPESVPDIKVNIPLGIQFQGMTGDITVKGNLGTNSNPASRFGSKAIPERTIALLGSRINLKNATIKNVSGNIELGSILQGEILIRPLHKYHFQYPKQNILSDINIDRSEISTIAADVELIGNNISLNESKIFSLNKSMGTSGSIYILAHNLDFTKSSSFSVSANDNPGNILIDVENIFILRESSFVATSLGEQIPFSQVDFPALPKEGGIAVNARFIIAFPGENINIATFNNIEKTGGGIEINSQGIFGFDNSSTGNSNNIFSAGELNIHDSDPTHLENFSKLPEIVENPIQVVKNCRPGQSQGNSSFVNVGRGGVPLSPHYVQTPPAIWQDLRQPQILSPKLPYSQRPLKLKSSKIENNNQPPEPASQPTIIEAQGWISDDLGRIVLTANVSKLMAYNSGQPIATC